LNTDDYIVGASIWIRDILQDAVPSFRATLTHIVAPRRSIPKVGSYRPLAAHPPPIFREIISDSRRPLRKQDRQRPSTIASYRPPAASPQDERPSAINSYPPTASHT
jgi:hypothetical protein